MKKRHLFAFLIVSVFLILLFNHSTAFFIFTTKATQQSFSASILVDTYPPDIILDSPLNITYNTSWIGLDYSVRDSASGVNTTWYNLNHGQNITITSNTTVNVNTLGGNTLYIYANDSAGLENSTEYVAFSISANKTVLCCEFPGQETTNFTQYTDEELENLTGVVLQVPDYGRIAFSEEINLSGLVTDFDTYAVIGENSIYLDANNLPNLNKKAKVQLYNLTFNNPRILRDGSVCPASICTRESYENNVLTFNVTGFSNYSVEETPEEQPTPTPSNAGGGGGGGQASLYSDFKIDPTTMKIKLRPGESDTRNIIIANAGEKTLSVELKLSTPKGFGIISKETLTIEPGQEEESALFFEVGKDEEPGVHTGKIIVEADGTRKEILVVIEIESEEKLMDVKLDIPEEYRSVRPGGSVYANIELFNMGAAGRVDVVLKYGVKDSNDTTIITESEAVSIETQTSIIRQVLLPPDMREGRYTLFVEAHYDGTVSTATQEFNVKKEEDPSSEGVLNNPYLLIVGIPILITLILILIALLRLKRHFETGRVGKSAEKGNKMRRKVPINLDEQEGLLEKAYKSGVISADTYQKDKERIRRTRGR